MKISRNTILIIICIVLFSLLVIGSIGANEAKPEGVTCDIGLFNEKLCFLWHQNDLGKLQEAWDKKIQG